MKIKIFLFICLIVCLIVLLMYFFLFRKTEKFLSSKENILIALEEFCNHHCGEDWSIDSIHQFNDMLTFVAIQTAKGRLDVSIQPKARAIIVEDTTIPNWKRRVFYYSAKNEKDINPFPFS